MRRTDPVRRVGVHRFPRGMQSSYSNLLFLDTAVKPRYDREGARDGRG